MMGTGAALCPSYIDYPHFPTSTFFSMQSTASLEQAILDNLRQLPPKSSRKFSTLLNFCGKRSCPHRYNPPSHPCNSWLAYLCPSGISF
jgi:hypothetical protein